MESLLTIFFNNQEITLPAIGLVITNAKNDVGDFIHTVTLILEANQENFDIIESMDIKNIKTFSYKTKTSEQINILKDLSFERYEYRLTTNIDNDGDLLNKTFEVVFKK